MSGEEPKVRATGHPQSTALNFGVLWVPLHIVLLDIDLCLCPLPPPPNRSSPSPAATKAALHATHVCLKVVSFLLSYLMHFLCFILLSPRLSYASYLASYIFSLIICAGSNSFFGSEYECSSLCLEKILILLFVAVD